MTNVDNFHDAMRKLDLIAHSGEIGDAHRRFVSF